jgi:hypothetical protein
VRVRFDRRRHRTVRLFFSLFFGFVAHGMSLTSEFVRGNIASLQPGEIR